MIRKLTKNDHDQLMEYLSKEKAMNLFLIGDVEAFGYDTEFQELWADVDDKGEFQGVLLRYYHGYIPYARERIDVEAFGRIMIEDEKFEGLSGKESIAEQFENFPGLRLGKKQSTFFAECINQEKLMDSLDLSMVKKATLDDVEKIVELHNRITQFQRMPNARERMIESMKAGISRTYFMESGGRAISSASTAAENSMSAMVVGVCTLPEFRQKGYATLIMNALCREVLQEGKTLCLFYDNPSAGRIYHQIGFTDIGRWVLYRN